jgi:hypothetical protein
MAGFVRPSAAFCEPAVEGLDARDKRGHDEFGP